MYPEEFLTATSHEMEYRGMPIFCSRQPCSWCQLATGGAQFWPSPPPYPSDGVMLRTVESPVSACYGVDYSMGFPGHGVEGISRSSHEQTLNCEGIGPEFPIYRCAEKISIDMNNRPETMVPSSAGSQNSESSSRKVFQSKKQSPNITAGVSATTIPELPRKTRIRWTKYLHEKFVKCVNRLGGAENATPKAIQKLMDSDGLTANHIKSHLQKYRLEKYAPCTAQEPFPRRSSFTGNPLFNYPNTILTGEAAELQLDMLRRLHEQLEIQNNLQARIEQQARKLQMIFDQQEEVREMISISDGMKSVRHEAADSRNDRRGVNVIRSQGMLRRSKVSIFKMYPSVSINGVDF